MSQLTEKQQKRLIKLQELAKKGNVALLKYLFEIEDKLDDEIPSIKDVIARVKGEDGRTPTEEELLALIEPLIPEVQDGQDYVLTSQDKAEIASQIKVPIVEKVVKETIREVPSPVDTTSIALEASKMAQEAVKPLIPTIEPVATEIAKNGEAVRDSLELLQGDERLDQSAIKGLEDIITEVLKNNIGRYVVSTGGGSVGARDLLRYYDLTDQTDGSTKEFSLPSVWRVIGVYSTQFPINYRPLVDWTVDGNTLTLTDEVSAPEAGQTLYITYISG
jgi:hypothetical protein